jgi:hypothetical protein
VGQFAVTEVNRPFMEEENAVRLLCQRPTYLRSGCHIEVRFEFHSPFLRGRRIMTTLLDSGITLGLVLDLMVDVVLIRICIVA